jgi:hypothetical protein
MFTRCYKLHISLQKPAAKLDAARGDRTITLATNFVKFAKFSDQAEIYMYEVVLDGLIAEDPVYTLRNIQMAGADE